MAKKKRQSSTDDETDFDTVDVVQDDSALDDDADSFEINTVLSDVFSDPRLPNAMDRRLAVKRRLATKLRLDAYLERKWFRENGWDEEDELFKDEFFGELDQRKTS